MRLGGDSSSDDDETKANRTKRGGCGCCCFCCIFLFVFADDIIAIAPTEYAIQKNWVTGSVDFSRVYHGGRHWIWPWQYYLRYPSTIQSLEWMDSVPVTWRTRDLQPLVSRTADGLTVQANIVMQYQLIPEQIEEMYKGYQNSYEAYIVSNMGMGFQEIISDRPSSDLWVNKLDVSKLLSDECVKLCKERIGFIKCWGVQLTGVKFDLQIEEKLVDRQVQVQLQSFHRTARLATLIRSQTQVNESLYDKDITIVTAKASADAFTIKNTATADAAKNMQEAKALGLEIVRSKTTNAGGGQFMNGDAMVKYTERNALVNNANSKMIYSGAPAQVVFGGADPGHSSQVRRLEAESVEPTSRVVPESVKSSGNDFANPRTVEL